MTKLILTPKEENFAQLVVELGNQSEAYRQSYNLTNPNADWVAVKASQMMSKSNIRLRVEEIKAELANKNKVTKQVIIDYHLKMIGAWEELWKLGQKKGKDKEETQRFYLLKEMVKGSDYRGSLDSITKMMGLNEPDKLEQKITTIEIVEKKR